jgi:glycosyltransferase involved in cell wall biosynthesis/GT2 family glycosyltransferase
MLKVSVVICAYTEDRWLNLVEAIEALQRQTHAPHEVVIIIDHNPSLWERVNSQFPHCIVLENDRAPGLSGARNSGVAAADGEIIAFLDDDAVPAANWLEQLCSCYTDADVMGVGGAIQPAWQTGRPAWFPSEFEWVVGCTYRGMPNTVSPVRNLIGANMSFRREIFQQIDGFSSEVGRIGNIPAGCEETELCIRARQHWPRKRLLYNPEARVSHFVPASRGQFKYFRARCYREGLSKATVSRLVGPKDGLSSERRYMLQTLPRGILDSTKRAILRQDWAGLGQAAAIVAGVTVTTVGYLGGRLAGRFQKARQTSSGAARKWGEGRKEHVEGRLRLLMVTPRYHPDLGGVENHVYQVARRLAKGCAEVTVLTTDLTGRLPEDELVEGVRIRRVPARPRNRDYYFAPDIYRFIRQGSWDILHVQSYHTLVPPLAMMAAWRAKIPYVVTFHGGGHSSRLRNSLRSWQRAALRPLLARAERLVALARFEMDQYGKELGLPRERFVLIPNGSDLPAMPRQASRSAQDDILIASVGRLEQYKGHHRVIAAMPDILKKIPQARLWIAGNGPYESDLRSMAENLGVGDRVEIRAVPVSDREAMAAELSKAHLFVLLSEFETHPIALLEAAALGCPALVADTSGLSELAESGLARAIPLRSASHQVAEAVIDLLGQPVRPEPMTLPTWDECASSLLQLYQEVVFC